jgi:glycosyl transferase family 25
MMRRFNVCEVRSTVKAYVISLNNSTRRKIVSERASKANLQIEFIDATDAGTSLTVKKLYPMNEAVFKKRYRRRQTHVELACLLSHHLLYQKLSKTNCDYNLILEDDFIPLIGKSDLANIILTMKSQNIDLMLLGYAKVDEALENVIAITNPLMNSQKIPGTSYVLGQRCRETTCGALSYLVSPKFLEIVSKVDDFGRLADDWSYHEKLGMKIAHISPLCFREDYEGMVSSLEISRAREKTNERTWRLPAIVQPMWRHLLGIIRRCSFYYRNI